MVLGIYGSGGLGCEILDLVKVINALENKWEKIFFINDFKEEPIVNSTEVFTFEEFKVKFSADIAKMVIAVGEPKVRQILREKAMKDGYGLQSLIHPNAFVGSETQIGDGTIIQYGCWVSCNTKIGANVLMQPISGMGHDNVIGSDTVISGFVATSGNCVIGEQVYIGLSTPVKENVSIGAGSIVGMGSVVSRDIPNNVIALGNPARAMKINEHERVFKQVDKF